jgi:hypothetical protein
MPEPTKAQLAAENKALPNALKRESAACKREAAARQRLEQQADLQTVLKTLLENATRLCAADWGVIFRPDADVYRMAALHGGSPEFNEFVAEPRRL